LTSFYRSGAKEEWHALTTGHTRREPYF
jgi:hypothetical protein